MGPLFNNALVLLLGRSPSFEVSSALDMIESLRLSRVVITSNDQTLTTPTGPFSIPKTLGKPSSPVGNLKRTRRPLSPAFIMVQLPLLTRDRASVRFPSPVNATCLLPARCVCNAETLVLSLAQTPS